MGRRLRLITVSGVWLAVSLLMAGASFAPPRPPILSCGQVLDATTGRPIAGVEVKAFRLGDLAKPPLVIEALTDSIGKYCMRPKQSNKVVFSASGYHALMLDWPEDLSPSAEFQNCPEDFDDVYLVRKEQL